MQKIMGVGDVEYIREPEQNSEHMRYRVLVTLLIDGQAVPVDFRIVDGELWVLSDTPITFKHFAKVG